MGFGKALTAGLVAATLSSQASALTFGIFQHESEASDATVAGIVTAQGHAFEVLDNLDAPSLAGIDVLWILNGDVGGQPSAGAISTFVANGGVLLYHDRNVALAGATLPGDDGLVFVRGDQIISPPGFDDYFSIQIVTGGTLVTEGPGGVLTDASLDDGINSSHGYAAVPSEVTVILSRTNAAEAVDFTYAFGEGAVYYSTMPLDFYLRLAEINPPDPKFATLPGKYYGVYAPNVVAYAASLVSVPEPAAVLSLVVGLLGLAVVRRRR